ncbi:MAG: Na+/H+ antiporter NhaA [Bdellovibrionaceae bacterium]|nr:Na+/H+ antiporter NhaA [Pseudobdellovibrionaceae bacterium]MBX3033520.1 Na+/H+ antiporter NhaA [Pseudobdellovibrionaceae bacterium]
MSIVQIMAFFVRQQVFPSLILVMATLIALYCANSVHADGYFSLLQFKVGPLSIQHWINDGLMTVFFFVVGMEIKKELLVGELSSFRKAALPAVAAVGGMVVPAAFFFLMSPSGEALRGWGIPMATDIAFALAALSVLGSRVPNALKIFLLALAIIDDLGAVLAIAFFYTEQIRIFGLLIAFGLLLLIALLKRRECRPYFVYVTIGIAAWTGFLYSGVHATVAGVLIGLMTPINFHRAGWVQSEPIAEKLIHVLHPWVTCFIVPLFAFANAGIAFAGTDFTEAARHPVALAISLGLVLGKPLGILSFSALAVFSGFAPLPQGVGWTQMMGVGVLAGIGFTMSIFISTLALPPDLDVYAKTGIMLGSSISFVAGMLILGLRRPSSALFPKDWRG